MPRHGHSALVLSILLGSLFLLPIAGARAEAQPSEQGALQRPLNQGGMISFHGDISNRYRLRVAEDSGAIVIGNELVQGLQLDLTLPEEETFSLHLSADARELPGGIQYGTVFAPLRGLSEAWPWPAYGNLYEAYLDVNRLLSFLPLVRIGRQASSRGEPLFFDGVTAEVRLFDMLGISLYGGLAVHFYEIDYAWGTDALAGSGIDFHPFGDTFLGLDYLFVADTRVSFLGSNRLDHLVSLKVHQRLLSLLQVQADFRMLNFAPRELKIKADAVFEALDLEITTAYFIQFLPQNELSNELSAYYDVIGVTEPFHSIGLSARQFLGAHLAVDVGAFLRGLLPGQAEGIYNRQYGKVSAGVELIDLPIPGLSFSVPGEIWLSGGNTFFSTGLSVSWRAPAGERSVSIETGTYFSLYKYDYYVLNGERENVQTYYAQVRVPVGRILSLSGRYEYEQGLQSFHSLSLEVRGAL